VWILGVAGASIVAVVIISLQVWGDVFRMFVLSPNPAELQEPKPPFSADFLK